MLILKIVNNYLISKQLQIMINHNLPASQAIEQQIPRRNSLCSDFQQSKMSSYQSKSNSKGKRRSSGSKRKSKGQIEKYIQSKQCEICKGMENQQQLLLCDRCDDSYHTYCLYPPLLYLPTTQWICNLCTQQLRSIRQLKETKWKSQNIEQDCHSCKQPLKNQCYISGVDKYGNKQEIPLKNLTTLKCLYCKHSFHNICFSQRKNSLNCWTCQRQIRSKLCIIKEQGPKCHDEFMKFIETCVKSVKQNPKCKFKVIDNLEDDPTIKINRCFRLKVPSYMTTWQSIAQNQASIYYAFKTKGLTFIDDQVYDDQLVMALNNPRKDINGPIPRLHEKDEKVYEQFKINAEKGYVGPFEVKEDRTKGFYLIATEYIEPLTIVSQYLGQVKTARVAINFEQNDSIFLLVRSVRSAQSLDIVPQHYGNISRFFLGINNEYLRIHGKCKMQNVKSLRFSYKGRVRLLLYTSKPIQAGQTLYFNYNGSAFHQYPTQNFVI